MKGARERPRVLVSLSAHGPRIVAANAEGFHAGARIGQRLADARAACPELLVDHADSAADAAMLDRLARFALRFSPLVAPDGLTDTDAGLLIDVEGCAHLFGGERAMLDTIVRRFTQLGFLTLAGLAPTPRAARALARYGDDPDDDEPPPILDHPMEAGALDAFPIEALGLEEDRLILLHRLGLKTIGAVRCLPRPALERRFRARDAARSVQLRLDQLTGAVAEPLHPIRPPEPYRTAISCPEPLLDVTGISWALDDLLARLTARLEREGLGARRFALTGFSTDGTTSRAAIGTARPTRDAALLARLFAEKLEAIDPGFGLEAFVLATDAVETLDARQTGWVPALVAGQDSLRLDEDVLALVDRLANRFGATAVYSLAPMASHVPETAQRRAVMGASAGTGTGTSAGAGPVRALSWQDWHNQAPNTAPRPMRLLDRPEPADVVAAIPDGPPAQLVWRRVRRGIVRARGPERIAAPWWQDENPEAMETAAIRLRDYYDVEDEAGRRYWLFRAGLYGDATRADPPRWFVHGLFQ